VIFREYRYSLVSQSASNLSGLGINASYFFYN